MKIAHGQKCPCAVARAAKAKARHDQSRPSSRSRGYDADWRACRSQFLQAFPACAVPGCGKPATDVDHRITIAERPDLRLSWSNLRPYCHGCHSRWTAKYQGFARPRKPT
ncbi:hypothetical protein ACO34A_09870 [Rhizobium sp. ACO-34A]|nr:hypothetical protein ACO34A_09870 [Rhizobium sp. ACO-34A]